MECIMSLQTRGEEITQFSAGEIGTEEGDWLAGGFLNLTELIDALDPGANTIITFRNGAELCYDQDEDKLFLYAYHYSGRDVKTILGFLEGRDVDPSTLRDR